LPSADFYHDLIYKEYDDVFLTELPPQLPPLRGVSHHIPVKIDTPWVTPHYHLPGAHKRALDKDIDIKLRAGIVVPTTTIPLATSHMVLKKDPGTYRHVQDDAATRIQTPWFGLYHQLRKLSTKLLAPNNRKSEEEITNKTTFKDKSEIFP
jgi:hypothetical protein